MRRALLIAILFALGCARMPPESKIPEPRAAFLSAAMLANVSTDARESDAPVDSASSAWVGFRTLFPDEAKDCDGWAQLNDAWVFSIRPEEKKQEAGFKDIVYVKNGTTKFRRFSAAQLMQ